MERWLSTRMLGLDASPAEAIDLAARHGFEGVELLVRDIVEREWSPDALAAMLRDRGLVGGSWPLPVDWRGDVERFRIDLASLPRLADTAARIGLDRTGTWIMPEVIEPAVLGSDRPFEAALALLVERLDAIAAILNDHGHRLGLEAIGVASARSGSGVPFLDRLAALDPLLGELRARGRDVGIVADAYHLAAAGEPTGEVLRWGADAIVAVHLADAPAGAPTDRRAWRDSDRALPGRGGRVPCARLLRSLAGAGYAGPVFAEPVIGAEPRRLDAREMGLVVQRTTAALDETWPQDVPPVAPVSPTRSHHSTSGRTVQ